MAWILFRNLRSNMWIICCPGSALFLGSFAELYSSLGLITFSKRDAQYSPAQLQYYHNLLPKVFDNHFTCLSSKHKSNTWHKVWNEKYRQLISRPIKFRSIAFQAMWFKFCILLIIAFLQATLALKFKLVSNELRVTEHGRILRQRLNSVVRSKCLSLVLNNFRANYTKHSMKTRIYAPLTLT